ncbi:metallophosphoesterase [Sphingomonas koreensis]|uniref:metallophosphoesterase family protein n=1 Tax=Sphingomonas koreensis TaxID=93064 RepID=UPI00082B8900|nr:metallophosphoesterase family protein [Sphingomonas koreensis]PJI90812.1 putative phosphodiesterase [Sphingomonas koreensis]RSU60213.1 metallophosphoesterase [Sphingomonas koreensis]RSU65048.1 metallophosphoesterase [Sphingomonas koreensis]
MLAILSDIHGNLPALEAVIADARAAGATGFVNLGDSLSGPLWPAETADLLMREGWPTIAGNHERQLLTHPLERMNASDRFARGCLSDAHLAWLAAQPKSITVIPAILCVHGSPRSDVEHLIHSVEGIGLRDASDAEIVERLDDAAAPLILCGHTHVPRVVTLADGRVIANPGSVGLQAYTDDHPAFYSVENGDPLARYALVSGTTVDLCAIPYDHLAAAAKAAREGREDWAEALRSGRNG